MDLDVSRTLPRQVPYLDDRAMFIDVARTRGIQGIHPSDVESTRRKLRAWGLAAEPSFS